MYETRILGMQNGYSRRDPVEHSEFVLERRISRVEKCIRSLAVSAQLVSNVMHIGGTTHAIKHDIVNIAVETIAHEGCDEQ